MQEVDMSKGVDRGGDYDNYDKIALMGLCAQPFGGFVVR